MKLCLTVWPKYQTDTLLNVPLLCMCLDPGAWLVMAAFDHLVLAIYSVVAVFSELTSKILCDLLLFIFIYFYFFFIFLSDLSSIFSTALSSQTTITSTNGNKFNDRKIINFYFNSFHFWMTWHTWYTHQSLF